MTELKPSLEQIMNGLIGEVRVGKAVLRIAIGLNYADPDAWAVAPVFFGPSRHANLEVAQMYMAKLYDKLTRRRLPLQSELCSTSQRSNRFFFTKGSRAEVIEAANNAGELFRGSKCRLRRSKSDDIRRWHTSMRIP